MAMKEQSTVVGVFTDRDQAERAVEALLGAGFEAEQIGVATRGEQSGATEQDTLAGEGAKTGAVSGGLLGGQLGAAAVGLIPGIGAVLAAGALAAIAGGAVAGAGVGGVLGGLIGMGIPEDEARFYEEELKGGRTLVTVRAGDRADDATRILRQFGAYDWTNRMPATPETPESRRTLEMRAERLVADTSMKDAGEVVIRRIVEEVPGRLEIDAQHEEIEIEHVPIGEIVHERQEPWHEDDVLVVPVYEEQLAVVKRLVLREELRIRRVRVTERQIFEDSVRRERIQVEDSEQRGRVRDRDAAPPIPGEETPGDYTEGSDAAPDILSF